MRGRSFFGCQSRFKTTKGNIKHRILMHSPLSGHIQYPLGRSSPCRFHMTIPLGIAKITVISAPVRRTRLILDQIWMLRAQNGGNWLPFNALPHRSLGFAVSLKQLQQKTKICRFGRKRSIWRSSPAREPAVRRIENFPGSGDSGR